MKLSTYASILILAFTFSSRVAAQETDFESALDAGEFSTALQIANDQTDVELRGEQFAALVAAQAGANERNAMVHTLAQQPFGGGQQGGRLGGGGQQGGLGVGGQGGLGQGGGNQADFESLIELITATIEPDTWEEVGGPGAIDGFPGGVYVDADGVLTRIRQRNVDRNAIQREVANRIEAEGMRKVSLPRLERALELQIARGSPIPAELRYVGGLERIEYVIAYPDTGDLVVAGPATDDLDSALRLTDLAVVLRAAFVEQAKFGCSIDPITDNLGAAQEFLNKSSQKAIKPAQRRRWLERLRSTVGRQNIRVFGIEPDTITALALVEADYHMKLIGMGLEPAPAGVTDYLSTVELDANGQVPPMDVLRWWFALDYESIERSDDDLAFHLIGQSAQVLSENELLQDGGARQATGRSSALNSQFADSFSANFSQFVDAYPVYRRLRNIFDATMAASLIQQRDLAKKVGWEPRLLVSQHEAIVRRVVAPRQVDTVINHRVLGGRQIVAGVSGGVMAQPANQLSRMRLASDMPKLKQTRTDSAPHEKRSADERWWWD